MCIGCPLDLFVGCPLDAHCMFMVFSSAVYRMFIGFSLDIDQMFGGCSLDARWVVIVGIFDQCSLYFLLHARCMFDGFSSLRCSLDARCILFGCSLDNLWIFVIEVFAQCSVHARWIPAACSLDFRR